MTATNTDLSNYRRLAGSLPARPKPEPIAAKRGRPADARVWSSVFCQR